MANLNPQEYTNQYLGEMQGALGAQSSVFPEFAAQQARLAPALQQSQSQIFTGQGQSLLGVYGNLFDQAQAFQSRYGRSQMDFLGGLGSQATQNAYSSMNAGTRNLFDTMQNQANAELALGSSLSQQDITAGQQSARAAAEARGLNYGNQGIGMEVLNNYKLGNERLQQRRQYAGQAYQMGQGLQQFGAQAYLQPAIQASNQFGLGGIYAGSMDQYGSLGQGFLTPESQYMANIRASNIQMENARIAAENASRSSLFGGIGSLLGTFLGASGKKDN